MFNLKREESGFKPRKVSIAHRQQFEDSSRFLLETHNEMQCALVNIYQRVVGLLLNREIHRMTPLVIKNLEAVIQIIEQSDPERSQ